MAVADINSLLSDAKDGRTSKPMGLEDNIEAKDEAISLSPVSCKLLDMIPIHCDSWVAFSTASTISSFVDHRLLELGPLSFVFSWPGGVVSLSLNMVSAMVVIG